MAAMPASACQKPMIIIIAAAKMVSPFAHGDSCTSRPVTGSGGVCVVMSGSCGRGMVEHGCSSLAVTTETIRRDLSHLERRGVLRRVHGGAMPVERSAVDLVVDDPPGGTTAAAAALIAKAALDELPDRGSVILSAGAATECLAEMLPADRPLI